ncbi:MAG: Glyoxalase/bleomycin resistance protein/dioxygenase [Acidimicrobiia bacterium]|nr:Glyoxalase/bleomycin resistance protein/dioxygenase [Acidimicrobiia bacterium]
MDKTSYAPGTPSWIDIGSPDPSASAAFYGALFGWTCEEGPPEAGGYRMALLNGKPAAGIGPAQNPGPPFWSTYIAVTSADETAKKVEAAGGQVLVPPMDIFDFGRMAVFFDNVGAAISVWEPKSMAGASVVNEPGAFCWNEFSTRDIPKALEFYPAVFGWTYKTSEGGPMPYTEWSVDGNVIGGMLQTPEMVPASVPPHWLVYFAVEDCDASIAKAVSLGGTSLFPPMDIPVGRFGGLLDPHGAMFAVIALSGEGM